MLLDRSSARRPSKPESEALLIVSGKQQYSGTLSDVRARFEDEIRRHSATVEIRVPDDKGGHRTLLKRSQ